MQIGDRVKFKTNGGWYNGGVIEDMDDESCLIKVDKTGNTNIPIALPYFVRILFSEQIIRIDKLEDTE